MDKFRYLFYSAFLVTSVVYSFIYYYRIEKEKGKIEKDEKKIIEMQSTMIEKLMIFSGGCVFFFLLLFFIQLLES